MKKKFTKKEGSDAKITSDGQKGKGELHNVRQRSGMHLTILASTKNIKRNIEQGAKLIGAPAAWQVGEKLW